MSRSKLGDQWTAYTPESVEIPAADFARRRVIGLIRAAAWLPQTSLHSIMASAYLQGVRDAAQAMALAEIGRKE